MWAGKMVPQVKVVTAKSENLNWIIENHMVEGKNQLERP